MKTKTYTFYSDPGHGWIKVSKTELTKLGIADKITPYSYVRKEFAYLEEDLDALTFVTALRAIGIEPKYKEMNSNKYSKIRSYARFSLEN